MTTITIISFNEDEPVEVRREKIKITISSMLPLDIVDAKLHRNGYPDIPYGNGPHDLQGAYALTLVYQIIN
jgi:hypothetical protein